MTTPIKLRQNKTSGRQYAEIKRGRGEAPIRISTGTCDPKEAKKLVKEAGLDKIQAAHMAGTLTHGAINKLVHGHKMVMADFLDRWEESAKYRNQSASTTLRNIRTIRRWLTETKLLNKAPTSIKPASLYDWVNKSDERTVSARRRDLSSIRPFLTYIATFAQCVDPDVLQVSVDTRVVGHTKRESRTQRAFTKPEIKKFMAWVPESDHEEFFAVASRISLATGLRLGDVCQLEWSCFSDPGKISAWTDKSNTRVSLPVDDTLTPGLAKALAGVPINTSTFLFPEYQKRYSSPASRAWFSVTFSRILGRLGIEGVTFHSWRHTAITRWRSQGLTLDECASNAGHSSTIPTQIYDHT